MSEETKRFSMIVYDGINLFRDGTWTGVEFDTLEEGRNVIGFLEELNDEQVDHWIRVQLYLRDSTRSFNVLKYHQSYSGETTAHTPLHNEEWKETPGEGPDCIQAINWFDVQWSNCPVEVEEEVKKLWIDHELGNDTYFYQWEFDLNGDDDDANKVYPVIANYLKSRGITKCHIHWWW